MPQFREINQECESKCIRKCQKTSVGSNSWLCVGQCVYWCIYDELSQIDPCLANCAKMCDALPDLVDGRPTAEKMDCIIKCRGAFCH